MQRFAAKNLQTRNMMLWSTMIRLISKNLLQRVAKYLNLLWFARLRDTSIRSNLRSEWTRQTIYSPARKRLCEAVKYIISSKRTRSTWPKKCPSGPPRTRGKAPPVPATCCPSCKRITSRQGKGKDRSRRSAKLSSSNHSLSRRNATGSLRSASTAIKGSRRR